MVRSKTIQFFISAIIVVILQEKCSADFMLPIDALKNVTEFYSNTTETITTELKEFRTMAEEKFQEVIPILQSYEGQFAELDRKFLNLITDFNSTFLDHWTNSLSERLQKFNVVLRNPHGTVKQTLKEWQKDSQTAEDILSTWTKKHGDEEKNRQQTTNELKEEVNKLFNKIEGEVYPIFDYIADEGKKYEPAVEENMKIFDTKTEEIMEPAQSNGTDHIQANLELQKLSWVNYTELYMDELETIEDIITDNTTALRVEQSYLYSINETEHVIDVTDAFVEKLRTLIVLLITLILFLIDMLLLCSLIAVCCAKMILTNKEAYRTIYPKRYVPAKGPERHYFWARRDN